MFRDYHEHNFRNLRRINKWANFFKHPKEFLFTHWPTYYFADEKPLIEKDDVVINYQFIVDHYFAEGKPRPIILQNNNRVFVEIPNLEELTENFCNEMNTFFDFICENQIIVDYLKKKSTIELIYDSDDELGDGD